MADVAVILPCRGRHAQTLAYAARMRATAEVCAQTSVHWIAVGGADDHDIGQDLMRADNWDQVGSFGATLTFWGALEVATLATDAPILCAVANDLWAHARWLELGLAAYRARFADGEGLMGFSGDGHPVGHSCHFLIGRGLLDQLGGWPTRYRHNFGDAELCLRAQQLGRYGKARHAVLEHRHVWAGQAPDDAVYQAGRASWAQDQSLFEERKARSWI